MTRPLRVNVADGWYHCMHRGIERRALFREDRDRVHFLDLLEQTVERFRFRVHAYCLMDNHYHAIVQTPDANLSQGMQWLGVSYSSWFNARYDRAGPLFQGRFKSVPVEAGAWALELSQYVHLNPVCVGILGLGKHRRAVEALGIGPPPSQEEVSARLKALREYRWSSYRGYAGYCRAPKWLETAAILKRVNHQGEGGTAGYRKQVQGKMRRGVEANRLERFRDRVGIGSAEFVDRMRDSMATVDRETAGRVLLRKRRGLEEVLTAVEEAKGEPREDWLGRHGDEGKWLVLKLAREQTGLTLAELGAQVGGRDYAAVSAGLKYFERKLKVQPRLKRLLRTSREILNLET